MNDHFEEIKDYVLLMLGVPVIPVKISNQIIVLAIEEATKRVDSYANKGSKKRTDDVRLALIKDGAYLLAQKIELMYNEKTIIQGEIRIHPEQYFGERFDNWMQLIRETYCFNSDDAITILSSFPLEDIPPREAIKKTKTILRLLGNAKIC